MTDKNQTNKDAPCFVVLAYAGDKCSLPNELWLQVTYCCFHIKIRLQPRNSGSTCLRRYPIGVCVLLLMFYVPHFYYVDGKTISRWLNMSGACLNIAKSMGKDNALFCGSILVAEL